MLGWAGFWLLTLIWGSLYLLSRIGLESVDPLHLTFIRFGIAAICLNLIIVVRKIPFPTDKNTLFHLGLSGMGGLMIPILFLNWGLQTVESGVGSVLQATAAIFAAVVAHFVLADERLSFVKIVGVIISFVGVIVLTQRNVAGTNLHSSIEGQIAIVLSALSYAAFTIHSRIIMQRDIKPIVFTAISVMAATFGTGILMFVQTQLGYSPVTLPPSITPTVMIVILTLAFVHASVAYLLYYEVVATIGAAQATMVTYTIPPVALLLGVVFLNEVMDGILIVGTGLIFLGIAFTKLKVFEYKRSTIIAKTTPKIAKR